MAKKVTASQPVKTITQTTNTFRNLEKILTKPDNNSVQSKPKQVLRVKPGVKKEEEKVEVPKILNVRRSLDVEKSDESSLYVSALESLPEENIKRLSRTSKVG